MWLSQQRGLTPLIYIRCERKPAVYFGLHDGLENKHTQSCLLAIGNWVCFVLTFLLLSWSSDSSLRICCSTKPGLIPLPGDSLIGSDFSDVSPPAWIEALHRTEGRTWAVPALGRQGYTFFLQNSEMCLFLNIGLKRWKKDIFGQNWADMLILSAFILSFLGVSNV